MNSACSATTTSNTIEELHEASLAMVSPSENFKGAWQIARMRRLVGALIIRMQQNQMITIRECSHCLVFLSKTHYCCFAPEMEHSFSF